MLLGISSRRAAAGAFSLFSRQPFLKFIDG
jgi:hypothetical protein